jgi:hypothetical protein
MSFSHKGIMFYGKFDQGNSEEEQILPLGKG